MSPDADEDLDAAIATREAELADLYERRRERDHAKLLLAILQCTADWFTAKELRWQWAPLSSRLSVSLAGKSVKSVGRLLKRIADDQDRSVTVPALRLIRHKTTTAPTVWKIETYLPDSHGAPIGG